MMRSIFRSGETTRVHCEETAVNYESVKTVDSAVVPGVRFTISRMSFGRRAELTRRIWELVGRAEYLQAAGDAREKLEAALLTSEIERAYLSWGLQRIEGLTIDGQSATTDTAIARGPEELCREMLAAIRAECGLTDEERKN